MQDLQQWLREQEANRVKVGVTDVDGLLRTKYLSKEKVLQSLGEGFGFCNVLFGWDSQDVVYDNGRDDGSFADLPARLLPGSRRNIPWEGDLPFLLADFAGSDAPMAAACPRALLLRTVEKAREMGFEARFGPEYEWFTYSETPGSLAAKNFANLEPLSPGMFGYSGLRTSQNAPFYRDLFEQLGRFGIPLEGLHTETGPGVMEAAIAYGPAVEAADRAVLFKQGVKEIAYRHGLVASFMAKPSAALPGCGGHLHQSLWQNGNNVFHDPAGRYGMSDLFAHYVAGQLALLPALLPMFAPNVNSYKRFVAGSWAATRANWGVDNRTVALRVIPGSPKGTRLETRVAGADANPYLAIAAALAAGLYGIEKALPLTLPPVEGSAYHQAIGESLPTDLGAAAGAMRRNTTAGEILGPDFTDHFLRTREWEWRQFSGAVTDWERRRYFETA
ncbi:glutamine synthetase [Neolewinella lacunae]|uniref:Glutamine synthetase n=1 Tax=Neolewinella lacunae TaxID=1517758 RepID=A0A923T7T4_9BACT|nr:glutamine synthetase [Neolewinella lacunae]MBC6993223.1 glutamine synthetase [Neolewinella lacunae]MDN3635730.1 glutamine synthetase [Neolewinella lacunae]